MVHVTAPLAPPPSTLTSWAHPTAPQIPLGRLSSRPRPLGGRLVGPMSGAQFTRHPFAISTAADDAIGRSKARVLARFGRIDRRIREVTSPLDALLYASNP